jgi:hypothetical protein
LEFCATLTFFFLLLPHPVIGRTGMASTQIFVVRDDTEAANLDLGPQAWSELRPLCL